MDLASSQPSYPVPAVRQLAIPPDVLEELPEDVRAELADLPAEQQQAFVDEFRKRSKSLPMAYLCSLIYCHHALLGRWVMTGFMLTSLFIAAALGSIWWIIDLFRMPALVRDHNGKVAADVLQSLRGMAGDARPLAHS